MAQTTVAADSARKITAAAAAFLSALSPEQREGATFDFDSSERETWHYIPGPRTGLPLRDLDEAQIRAADALLAASLSEVGLEKSKAIIRHEVVLGRLESGEGNRRFDRNPGLYFFSVFGDAEGDGPWGWQVDGHHLSLNFTVADGEAIFATPSFFGANPAQVKHGPQKGLRILGEEEDFGRELFLSLDPARQKKATLYPVAPADILTRASPRVEIDGPAGLAAEAMSVGQRQLLVRLIRIYIDRKPEDIARNALGKVEAEGVGNIFFGWAGGVRRGEGHYYRVHGPSFFVEYDNTQNMANHVHSVWRDIEDDFGADLLRAHYQRHHS